MKDTPEIFVPLRRAAQYGWSHRETAIVVRAAFWWLVLTTGEPDVLGAVVSLIGRIAT